MRRAPAQDEHAPTHSPAGREHVCRQGSTLGPVGEQRYMNLPRGAPPHSLAKEQDHTQKLEMQLTWATPPQPSCCDLGARDGEREIAR